MFYIHVYINSSFIFTFFKKWILECIQSYNFSAYFSETKHCCCRLVAESWLTLCDLMACSLPSSSVHGISQARILECVAISFSRGSSWPRDQTLRLVCCTLAGRFFTVWGSHTWAFLTTISCNGCWLRRALHNRYSWSTKGLKNFEPNRWSHWFKTALCRRKSSLIKLSKHYFSGEV